MKKVEYYSTANGSKPCSEWINGLEGKTQAVIYARIDRTAAGLRKNVEPVSEGVFEIKIDFGPGYRVYFGQHGAEIIVLLAGGDKKTQSSDIEKAKAYWREYASRKKL